MINSFWQKLPRPILALAPMAGITDSIFRRICKEYGAAVVYSEMASASALFFHFRNKNTGPRKFLKKFPRSRKKGNLKDPGTEKTLKMVSYSPSESPYVVQLFGKNPEHFARAAQIVSEKIRPQGIDINFGCPAPKVFREGAGAALMLDKKLARKIISTVCENTHLPVSLKIRSGIKSVNAFDFIDYLKDLPFSAVMIHGRVYEKQFSGPADFEIMERIKAIIPDKIVLANGGINSPEIAFDILNNYPSLDGLGIARGALGRPYIFEEIKDLLQNPSLLSKERCPAETERSECDLNKIKNIMLHHAEMIWKEKQEAGIVEMRTHLSWYVRGFPNATNLRRQLMQVKNLTEIQKVLSTLK